MSIGRGARERTARARMPRAAWTAPAALALLAGVSGLVDPALAAWRYPPGPFQTCPDTLGIFDIQQTDTLQAPCHPVPPDTVLGIRGIVTALDTRPSIYGFYIQNTFESGPAPWTGVLVVTGAYNYATSQPGSPSGGNLVPGDSVVVYGSITEFTNETEIQGPDGVLSTDDLLIRRVASGVPLPAPKSGTTVDFNWLPAVSAATAEPWEGCLVQIDGPLQVARTQVGAGVPPNGFLVVDPLAPGDSVLVDGGTLTTMVAPAVGTTVNFVRGILNQRTSSSINTYRIQLRGPDDLSAETYPSLIDAYPIEDNRVRLVFDKNLDALTAMAEPNYSLVSGATVSLATLVGGAGTTVELDLSGVPPGGQLDSVRVQGVGTSVCPLCLSPPQSLPYFSGVLAVSDVQQPDPAYLAPCDDRSRFAGAATALGDRLTVRGVAVQSYGSLAFIADPGGGARSGVAVFGSPETLVPGRTYRIAARVQEFFGSTELVSVADVLDEGPATVPAPSTRTVGALADTTCDATQSAITGEDFEGTLVHVENATIVPLAAGPADPPPGGDFRLAQAMGPGEPDTIVVSNPGGLYTFDPDPGMVLGVSGILHHSLGTFRIQPRGDNDITYLTGIAPGRGGGGGQVWTEVTGYGLQSGCTVSLLREGAGDIAASTVVAAPDGRTLTAIFDLTGATPETCDVIVGFPDAFADTLYSAFVIEAAAPQQLRVDIIGPTSIRPERRKAFDIVLENLDNGDVLNVPLWISRIPASATVELDFPLTAPASEGGEPDWSAAPLTLDGALGRYVALVIPRLAPGTTVRRVYVTVPSAVTSFELEASITAWWGEAPGFVECLDAAGAIEAPSCVASSLAAIGGALVATPEAQAMKGAALWAKVAWQCEGASTLAAALAKAEVVLDQLVGPVEGTGVPPGCEVPLAPRWQDRRTVAVVMSVDPNDKLGIGRGASRLIGIGQVLPYSIRFENLEAATAPAQEVVVVDALDPVTMDFGTVTLGPITFGTRTISPVSGLANYTTEVDLRPERDIIVQVGVGFDQATGVLTWTLTARHPTGRPLEDDEGFLPPNVTPPEGEGSVLFTVMPKEGLADGTPMSNRAMLVFDGTGLLTPEWLNLIDTTPPQSEILPLSATQDSASFTVRWQAVGAPPDLHDYSVYVSEDGGTYRPWRTHVTATADTFSGPGGRTYAFYSLARDSSGNLEPVPEAPDVQTYSRVAVDDRAPPEAALALEGAAPNPVTGAEARVWFTLPSAARATLEVVDVAGRRVMRREVGALGPGRHAVDVGAATRRPGLYFVRLAQGGRSLTSRLVAIP